MLILLSLNFHEKINVQFFRSCICLLLLITTPVGFIDCREHHHSKHHHKKHKHHNSKHHSKHKSRHNSKTIAEEKGLNDLHLWTYDEILRLLDEVESGKIAKKCSGKDCKKIDHFLALLAKEGQSSENPSLDNDIAELIPENNSAPFENISETGVNASIASMSLPLGSYFSMKAFQTKNSHKSSWKKTKKFAHKHRKAIIIGIVVVVAVVVVVTVVVMTSAPAAGAVVSAVGTGIAASEGSSGNDPPSNRDIKEVIDEQLEMVRGLESENLDLLFENKARQLGSISAHGSLENLALIEDRSFKHEIIDREFSTDYATYYANGERAFKEYEYHALQSQEAAYEFNSGFIKGVPHGAYDSGEILVEFAKDLSTHPIKTSIQIYSSINELAKLAKSGEWKDISQTLAPEVYQLVTNWDNLSPSERGELSGYAFGKYGADIIIPGAAGKLIARGAKTSRILMEARLGLEAAETALIMETTAGTKVALIAEDLGVAAIESKPNFITTTTKTFDHFTPEMQASYNACKKAEAFLKPNKGFMPEAKARQLIHESGFSTYPRPKGIPENYLVELSDKGAGIKYVDPTNSGAYVRVMPGKPHSPLPHQQKPYVSQMKDGKAFNKSGDKVLKTDPEAHIPIDEFVFKGK